MGRLHAIAISVLLGGAAVSGAAAAFDRVRLGPSAPGAATARVPDAVIAGRRAKLAGWSRSLTRARAAQPPALPEVPSFPRVTIPTVPAQLPAPAPNVPERRPKHRVAPVPPAAEQITYVQAPPIVQYQQAAPVAVAATTSTHHEDDTGEHDDHEEHDGGSSSGGDD